MKNTLKKTITIGFTWVIGLLLTGAVVQAQEIEPIPIPSMTVTNTYAAKFICGVQPDASIKIMPDAQAGHYSSKINVHNNTGIDIRFRKKVIRLRGGQIPTPPAWSKFHTLVRLWAGSCLPGYLWSPGNRHLSAGRRDPALHRRFRDLRSRFQQPSSYECSG
jgi:hypothetical protein